MTINTDHLLTNASYIDSPNKSGTITPRFIVMHYTAGWTAHSAISTLINPASKASAHVVVDLNGMITQLVPFNRKAWHAGPSRHAGFFGLNTSSIGIEIVNIGFLKKVGQNQFMDDYGAVHTAERGHLRGVPLIESKHARVGGGTYYWPAYTTAQLDAVEILTKALTLRYGILDILSHEEIDTRGWKTDPGPAFPMERFRSLTRERGNDEEVFVVTASSLNIRSGPGVGFSRAGSLKSGDRVSGMDRIGDWLRISTDGWVHSGFLRREV